MLYSWVSAFGVSILLICTPIGFSRMFDVVGNKVVKPTTARNLEEECLVAEYEEEYLRGRMDNFNGVNGGYLPKVWHILNHVILQRNMSTQICNHCVIHRWAQLTSPTRRAR